MKLPKQAKKVFTGDIFSTYQWPQKMYDGSVKKFEMLKRDYTVQVIATRKNKIVIGWEKQPNKTRGYTLFGGRIDKGEKPFATAKRELLEEAGLTSKNWVKFYNYQPITKLDWEIYYYIARDCEYSAKQNLDNGEKIKIMEVTFEEFYKIWTETFYGHWFSYYLVKLKAEGKLNEFKKMLFGKI